jgi:Restriction endonuclease fold toxin 9
VVVNAPPAPTNPWPAWYEGYYNAGVAAAAAVPAVLEALALLPHGTVEAKSGTSGETPAAARGRQAHKDYDPGAGFEKEPRGFLPGLRPDAVNKGTGVIKELKPDTKSGLRRGMRQLGKYVEEANKHHPRPGRWRGELDSYPQ